MRIWTDRCGRPSRSQSSAYRCLVPGPMSRVREPMRPIHERWPVPPGQAASGSPRRRGRRGCAYCGRIGGAEWRHRPCGQVCGQSPRSTQPSPRPTTAAGLDWAVSGAGRGHATRSQNRISGVSESLRAAQARSHSRSMGHYWAIAGDPDNGPVDQGKRQPTRQRWTCKTAHWGTS